MEIAYVIIRLLAKLIVKGGTVLALAFVFFFCWKALAVANGFLYLLMAAAIGHPFLRWVFKEDS